MAHVVVAVDELERPAGAHVQCPGARQALGQRDLDAAVVALALGHLAQVAGAAQIEARARAVGVGAEPHRIGPAAGVGDADAQVGHGPLHGDGLAAEGDAGGADRLHLQVGVGDGHHVQRRAGGGAVVGLGAVFPHRAGRVGHHEHLAVARKTGPKAVRHAAGVAAAHGQAAGARHLAQHQVVGVADHVVGRVDDAVGPAQRAARAGAQIADGPLHGDAGGVVDEQRGRHHGGDGQVGEVVARDVDRQAGGVVGLAQHALGVVGGAVGDNNQAPRALQVHRQRDVDLAVDGRACGQRAVQHLAQQSVRGVHHAVARQVNPLVQVAGVGAAVVVRGPAQHDGLAALQQAHGLQRARHQIGRHHRDGPRGQVVGLGRFVDVVATVGHQLQAPDARQDQRHGDRQALRQRAPGGQVACRSGGSQHH